MKISKIAMFTILMLNGTAKSQEFYTCIPNDDWVKGLSKGVQRSDEEVKRLARETRRSDEEVKRLARETRRSDEEVRNLARQVRRSDEEVRNLARQVRRSDSEIKNLITSNSVGIECRTYNLKNDRSYLENMTGINIIKFRNNLFLCKNLYYELYRYREDDSKISRKATKIYCTDLIFSTRNYSVQWNRNNVSDSEIFKVEVCKLKY